jgi:hypothetical protein
MVGYLGLRKYISEGSTSNMYICMYIFGYVRVNCLSFVFVC